MIEVNIYLWVGLIVGLVFCVVYISNLNNRLKKLEAIFVASMAAVAQDVMALEDKIQENTDEDNEIREDFDNLKEWINDKLTK